MESVKVYLTGQDPTSSVQTAVTEWFKQNDATIRQNGMVSQFQLSSWAIVVDITWKKAFNDVRTYDSTDDTKIPAVVNNVNYQFAGSIGDTIGVLINVKDQPWQQPWIRVAQTVTKQGTTSSAQTNKVSAASIKPFNLFVASYTELAKNTQAKVQWGPTVTCELGYWEARACEGFDIPWGLHDIVDYAPAGT